LFLLDQVERFGHKSVHTFYDFADALFTAIVDYIYVRVFEDRMDLIRAVIVGASGTPYQDGLFFFDFHLPPEFPQAPPVSTTIK
jgi:ubiquitin-protein ligase